MDHSGKYFPRPTVETLDFWEGCAEGELRIQCCLDCGCKQFYPRIICSQCMSKNLEWSTSLGSGELVSFSIVRRAVSKAYEGEVPYVVALIKLDEGPVLMSNIVECSVEKIAVGQRLEVVFEKWSDEITVPKFRPVS